MDRDRDRIADVAIDRAVREIMSADPGPAFRQRVLARIVADPAAVRRPWLPQLVVAAAVIALAFAAILWVRHPPATAPASTTVAATPPAIVSPPLSPRPPAPATLSSSRGREHVPIRPPARRPASRDVRVADRDANAERIVEAASIETALVDGAASQAGVPTGPAAAAALPGAVRLAEIALPPIVIKEIVLEPLPSGGR